MKDWFESSEAFTAHATISAGYFMIGELHKKLAEPLAPITRMVDISTGYEDAKNKEITEQLIVCLNDIIEAKKFIEADYTKDVVMLEKSKEFLKSFTK